MPREKKIHQYCPHLLSIFLSHKINFFCCYSSWGGFIFIGSPPQAPDLHSVSGLHWPADRGHDTGRVRGVCRLSHRQRWGTGWYTVDREIFVVKNFLSTTFSDKIFCSNVRRPIPILVTKVWRRNLDYTKNLQANYFTSENIPIYGTCI